MTKSTNIKTASTITWQKYKHQKSKWICRSTCRPRLVFIHSARAAQCAGTVAMRRDTEIL